MAKNHSLRTRLSWYMFLAVALMTLISGRGIYLGIMHEAEEIFGASLVQTARILEGVMTRKLIESSREHLRESLAATDLDTSRIAELEEYEEQLFFAVLDKDNQLLLKSPFAPTLASLPRSTGFAEFSADGTTWYSFALDSRHDDLRIVVGESKNLKNELSESILNGLLWPLLVLLPLMLVSLLYLIRVALAPLNRIGDELRDQNIQNLRAIDVAGVPAEITPLVNSLNRMIENLDQAYQRERRFVSDASHELRNPLAALLIHIENAIEENCDPELGDSLHAMHHSIQRLVHLVAQLLQLSHSENPLAQKKFEPVDLAVLCNQVIDNQRAVAATNHQTLEYTGGGGSCMVQGSLPLLQSLLTNLVENAIRYSGNESLVRIQCEESNGVIVINVEDSGPGVDEALLVKLFQRFFRAGESKSGGAGLGLSIVQVIAETHGARIELGRSRLGGLRVNIQFPSCRSTTLA